MFPLEAGVVIRRFVLVLGLVVAGSGARAGVRPPADLSTPEKAMATFIWAYRIQDGMTMADATLWEDQKDLRRLFLISPSDSINQVWIYRDLSALYAEAFAKDEGARKWIDQVAREIEEKDQNIAEDMKKVAASIKVSIEGDIATCTTGHEGGDMLLKFKKADGKWKLLPLFFGTEVEAADTVKNQIDLLNYEITDKTYATFKADVKAGKFKTWKQADEALTERMLQVPAEVEKAFGEKKEKADRESAPKK
jgi:hypothetical protein